MLGGSLEETPRFTAPKTRTACDAYSFGLPILDTKWIFCPPLWKLFNSYDFEEFPEKIGRCGPPMRLKTMIMTRPTSAPVSFPACSSGTMRTPLLHLKAEPLPAASTTPVFSWDSCS